MSESRYLIRFDDICPAMNWKVWDQIEPILDRYNAKPILAVVPDNQDPKLMVDEPRSDFWERVRGWQAKGYTIALHGYQHRYVNKNSGMIGLNPQSEFAGLSRAEQEDKLRKGLAIFAAEGVIADAWVAPSHSFDPITVDLLAELGVPVISDGLWPMPFTHANGITWVPQQLWSFEFLKEGVWTVCYHHNDWSMQRVEQLDRDLQTYAAKLTSIAETVKAHAGRQQTLGDRWTAFVDHTWSQRIEGPLWVLLQRFKKWRAART